MGAMTPPSRKSCYNFRVIEINRVVDGDTIDVTIDLGFDLYKKERVRVAGVDTPEKRTRDLEEKALGLDATYWMKENLEGAVAGDDDLIIRTELVGGMGKYGRLLGWLYIGDAEVSLNEKMIEQGYAWAYDGGTNIMALTSFIVSVTIAAGGFWLYKSRDVMIENAKEQIVKEISEALPGIVNELIPDIPEMPSTTGGAIPSTTGGALPFK